MRASMLVELEQEQEELEKIRAQNG